MAACVSRRIWVSCVGIAPRNIQYGPGRRRRGAIVNGRSGIVKGRSRGGARVPAINEL